MFALFASAASEAPSAARFVPASRSLETLRRAAKSCEGCDLYKYATQTVFGEGSSGAAMLLVGEQPGDQEDLRGRPFVGPAGEVLDRALAEAGVERREIYVTNVVKHFKFEPRGKRRIHKRPGATEISACMPWLEAEMGAVAPQVLVCLGATAAQALLGRNFRLMENHGRVVRLAMGPPAVATVHPSAVLRAPDSSAQEKLFRLIVEDLRVAARIAKAS
ncbi:MAG TPA: UdgX family uracil-DNA binding protein [Thermoanaerobaculia bacterium]